MPKQFDLFKKSPEQIIDPKVVPPPEPMPPHEPTDDDLEFAAGQKLFPPGVDRKAYEEFQKDWREQLGAPGSQPDLPLNPKG